MSRLALGDEVIIKTAVRLVGGYFIRRSST
jgi:hypothetical protein